MSEMTKGMLDVLAERKRQQEVEGFDVEHDRAHDDRSIARAGACYAKHYAERGWLTLDAVDGAERYKNDELPYEWPEEWDPNWWKPTTPRRDLVKAAALLIAEIDRIDALEVRHEP